MLPGNFEKEYYPNKYSNNNGWLLNRLDFGHFRLSFVSWPCIVHFFEPATLLLGLGVVMLRKRCRYYNWIERLGCVAKRLVWEMSI
jgi:hypothetical protein